MISPVHSFISKLSIALPRTLFSQCVLAVVLLAMALVVYNPNLPQALISPLASFVTEDAVASEEPTYEVFGFAPFWTLNRLDNVDFSVLTTLAYFCIPLKENGHFEASDPGYIKFHSKEAASLFDKARSHNTKIVATLTLMENYSIKRFLENPNAQENSIRESVALVRQHALDGINIDIEYSGNPGSYYRDAFSRYVENFTTQLHNEIPGTYITVSVYAAAAKDPQLYDIGAIGNSADGIFMMAYDFATKTSRVAMPTAPLYGHKEGKYWYDISTAVEDFLKVMPADKLILGVPYYSYNYAVRTPQPGTSTIRYARWIPSLTQTHDIIDTQLTDDKPGITQLHSGFDEASKVSWKAYRDSSNTWRLVFTDDSRSLAHKYDFAKEQGLAGVGMWALGFDSQSDSLWQLLVQKFGSHIAKNEATQRG